MNLRDNTPEDRSSAENTLGDSRNLSFPSQFREKKRRALTPLEKRIEPPEPLSPGDARRLAATAKKLAISPLVTEILYRRETEDLAAAEQFLFPHDKDLSLLSSRVKNMDAAAQLLCDAIVLGKKIAIVCDYDVDGASSASQLLLTVRALGGKATLIATDRFQSGYGLKESHIVKAKKRGAELLCALDVGTSDYAALECAKNRGLSTLVVDHHRIDKEKGIPPAALFVNPDQEGCRFEDGRLCTAGLSHLLCLAMLVRAEERGMKAENGAQLSRTLIQLAAFGTCADQVPLVGLNREIVKNGLSSMNREGGVWIDELKRISGSEGEITSSTIAFRLAPMANAVGRLADAERVPGVVLAIRQLSSRGRSAANNWAIVLQRYNTRRKALERAAVKSCSRQLRSLLNEEGDLPPALVVGGRGCHPGVSGLVAARLCERWNRPVVVLSGPNKEGKLIGSARSPEDVDIYSCLKDPRVLSLLKGAGGHAAAAGCSLDKNLREEFTGVLSSVVEEKRGKTVPHPKIKAEIESSPRAIVEGGEKLVQELALLEPSGRANPAPKILLKSLRVCSTRLIGKRHLQVVFRSVEGGPFLEGRFWFMKDHPHLTPGKVVNVVGRPDIDMVSEHNPELKKVIFSLLAAEESKPFRSGQKAARVAA